MSYSLFILRRAQKELGDLPPEAYDRVRQQIQCRAVCGRRNLGPRW
jgi:mRNA-degrading endonuclease RelE of RelBE toxin-antitoxin system